MFNTTNVPGTSEGVSDPSNIFNINVTIKSVGLQGEKGNNKGKERASVVFCVLCSYVILKLEVQIRE